MLSTKQITKFDPLLHIFLHLISTLMTVLLFQQLGTDIISKVAFILLAIVFDSTKISDLHKFLQFTKKRLIFGTFHFLKTLLSIFASVAFVLTLISAQDSVSAAKDNMFLDDLTAYDDEIKYWNNELLRIDETISLLNDNLDRNPEGYGISGKTFVTQIQLLQEQKVEYHELYVSAVDNRLMKLSEVNEQTINVSPTDIFTEISALFELDSSILKVIIFGSIMTLLEISIALTSYTPLKDHKELVKSDQFIMTYEKNKNESVNRIGMNKTEMTYKYDISSLPEKGRKVTYAIAHHQSLREKDGLNLLTQSELAVVLNTTPVIINNMVRRYVKPLIEMNKLNKYSELRDLLKAQ